MLLTVITLPTIIFSEYFGCPLSVPFYQCSVLIVIYMVLVLGQTEEALLDYMICAANLLKAVLFRKSGSIE